MNSATVVVEFDLQPEDNAHLARLCGPYDEFITQVAERLGVEINRRGHTLCIIGLPKIAASARAIIMDLFRESADSNLDAAQVHLAIEQYGDSDSAQGEPEDENSSAAGVQLHRHVIRGRSKNQRQYIHNVRSFDLNFAIGPAGTGKTYLAVACAVEALERDQVERLVLVRPAVEAGEKLGFLPGDMAQKVDPYLRPVYDALFNMLGAERATQLTERGAIEVAPLAFMRGRTLNQAFVILDEAQNATIDQMKMFLTRIGFSSKAVVTGDLTQSDLPKHRPSGLRHAEQILSDVDGIRFNYFTARDVVRHPLVKRIIDAYDRHKTDDERSSDPVLSSRTHD